MVKATPDWEAELGSSLEPFLERLGHKARRRMCPPYVSGLIGPGDRKIVQPMAERFAPSEKRRSRRNPAHAPATGFVLRLRVQGAVTRRRLRLPPIGNHRVCRDCSAV